MLFTSVAHGKDSDHTFTIPKGWTIFKMAYPLTLYTPPTELVRDIILNPSFRPSYKNLVNYFYDSPLYRHGLICEQGGNVSGYAILNIVHPLGIVNVWSESLP